MTSEPATRGERLGYRVVATVERVARALPTATGRALFRWLGTAAFHLARGPRAVVAANQAQVLGRPPGDPLVVASTREAFQLYGRYWFDAFHVVDWPDERIRREFVFEGMEHVEAARALGKGVICVLPHMGNWDAAGKAMVANGHPVVAVAEQLRPPALFELFLRHREELGMEPIGLTEGGHVGQKLASALAANKIVALVADRDLTGRGVEVEMFGRSRRIPAGPGMLSITSGAPILICDVYQRPRGWRCVMHLLPEIERTGDRRADVSAISRAIAQGFEEAISAAPSDWHLFQPAWD
ncbi:MAG TPA: phosphatidylinositol mannoside acyltransferase [Actinomycetota bacterium]